MKRIILGGVGTILFSFFAYWQLNDLAQYGTKWWHGWLLTYAMTAIICLVTCFSPLPRQAYWLIATIAVIHAIIRATSIDPENKILYNPDNPAGNEAGGLVIVCIWLILLSFCRKKM